MKERNMKRVEGVSKLTAAQKKSLEALAALNDSEIDTSDIPEWTEKDFSEAVRLNGMSPAEAMRMYKIRKAPITARIDLDILKWLKGKGEGYQTRLNAILRDAMMKDLRQHRQ